MYSTLQVATGTEVKELNLGPFGSNSFGWQWVAP
jgi:hypothetical protein